MPNYMNPYMPYYNQPSYGGPQPMQSNVIPVDGEIAAKAFSIPAGSTGPIALWDTNDSVIYMRTFNAAGMPMPLKRLRYVEEETQQYLPGQSGAPMDTSQFVTKSDFEQLRQEIQQMQQAGRQNNQNGNQNVNRNNNQGRQV